MSEKTFTSGPWMYAVRCNHDMQCAFAGVTIGRMHIDIGFENDSKSVSDAHLIAAAPDLYDALKDLLSRVSNDKDAHAWWCDEQEQAIKALAKARGEL